MQDDDDSEDGELHPTHAPCTDENACKITEGSNVEQPPDGGSALSKDATTSPTELPVGVSVAVTGGTEKRSDDTMTALGLRAAAEVPTSGKEGGGEVAWFDQMEWEQGEVQLPGVAALDLAPISTIEPSVPQNAAAPAIPVDSQEVPAQLSSSQAAIPGMLAAAEMPVSGLEGDAAVDWFDQLERQQGEMGSQGMAPLRKRGSLAQFKHVTSSGSIMGVGSQEKQLDGACTGSGAKSFANVMLGGRAMSSIGSTGVLLPCFQCDHCCILEHVTRKYSCAKCAS